MPLTNDGYAIATSNPDHQKLVEHIAEIRAIDATIADLNASDATWRAEAEQIRTKESLHDNRRVQLVVTLQTKIGMIPFAVEREQKRRQSLISQCSDFVGPLHTAADAMLDDISTELTETIRSTVGLYVEKEEQLDEAAHYLFARTEFGRRVRELAAMKSWPPVRDHGEANHQAVWFARISDLFDEWQARKLSAGKVSPAAAA